MGAFIAGIDFDGTLVDHRFPDIGEDVPGAFPWLRRYQAAGAKLVLWTMRSDGRPDGTSPLADAVVHCRARGIEFWGVNQNHEQRSWTLSPKVYAHVYIDDAAACCPLRQNPRVGGRPFVDWDVVGPAVMAQIEAHNRKQG